MQKLLNSDVSLKKIFRILCTISMLLISMPVSNGTAHSYDLTSNSIESNESPAIDDGTFEKVWVDHDVRVEGKKGMRIHAKFLVRNSLGLRCRIIAQFYRKNGIQLSSEESGGYKNVDNKVVTFENFTPSYNVSRYSDKTLFIPYSAFNLKTPGVYELKFVLYLERMVQGGSFAHSEDFNFTYKKS